MNLRRCLFFALLPFAAALVLAACTTTEEIRRPDGTAEYIIGCGAGSGWNICYDRANELCPDGYRDISREGGINRKEIWIECPGAKN